MTRTNLWLFLAILAGVANPGLAGDPTPKVLAIWPSGPLEVRVSLDRPADEALALRLVGTRVAFGDAVKAGDQARTSALSDPADPSLGSIRIAGASLADEGRTLILATDPHPRETRYALRIPTEPKPVDVVYDLSGVEVAWDNGEPGSEPAWKGWWPTLDSRQARERLSGSEEEVKLAERLAQPGRLTLHTLVRLPKGKPSLVVRASHPFEVNLFTESVKSKPEGKQHVAELAAESIGEPVDLTLALTLQPDQPLSLAVEQKPNAQAKPKPLVTQDLLLAWAPPLPPPPSKTIPDASLYTGGDAKKGESVFASETAKCSVCHQFRGKGGLVGPALDEVTGREKAWIYRQVAEPSATIHTQFIPYTVVTKDGRIALGIVRALGLDKITVTDTEAKTTTFTRSEIEELRPSNTSIMPVGLTGAIGEESVRNLIAYLSTKTSN